MPFRALPADELLAAWKYQARRQAEALDALVALGEDVAVDFTIETVS